MIEIDSVTKSYGDHRVVDRLSLTVGDGVLCVLLGSFQAEKFAAVGKRIRGDIQNAHYDRPLADLL